jgi:hypothetical protein
VGRAARACTRTEGREEDHTESRIVKSFAATDSHSIPDGQSCQFAQRAPQSHVRLSDTAPFAVRSSFVPAYAVDGRSSSVAISGRVQSSFSEATARGLARGERAALSLRGNR